MTYEQKMHLLQACKPEKKDALLMRILRGETVDITKDEDLFFQVNKDRVSLEQFTNRDKFKSDAQAMKWAKQNMHDPSKGKTKGNKMRWLGDIPSEIYFSRPEFSPLLPKHEREKNIRKFLNQFPVFKAGDKLV